MSMSGLPESLDGKRLLIFDFDGTVADTSPLHARAFNLALAGRGLAVDYPSIAGLKTADAMRKLLTNGGQAFNEQQIAELTQSKQAIVRELIATDLMPIPGMDAFLRWAKPRYRLCMVTSGSRATVHLALDKLGFRELFDPIICSEDVEYSKPDPEGFLLALRLTGAKASESVVFEDSDAGFVSAEAACIDCIDVNNTNLFQYLKNSGVAHGH